MICDFMNGTNLLFNQESIGALTGINGSIGDMEFHSQVGYDCLINGINEGFKFSAQKYAVWIDLLFVAVIICTAAKALQGLSNKYPQIDKINKKFSLFGEELTLLKFIESTSYEFLATMSLTLFALQYLKAFV